MQAADRQRFATLLSGIADYYGKEVSNAAITLYWRGLEQYDIADVESALWAHTQNPDAGQYLPKIADITRLLSGGARDQAAIAWSKVDNAVRTLGTYGDVVFDDALIHRVIGELGGWIWLGKQVENEWPFIAQRFEALYRSYCKRTELPPYPPLLTGLANAHNKMDGHQVLPPLLIGDPAKAEQVYRGGSATPFLQLHRVADRIVMQNMALLQKTPILQQPSAVHADHHIMNSLLTKEVA
jgi:hypothetical protein